MSTLSAQMLNHEYFVSFDYENMQFERRSDSLPGIKWVGVNSTFDADEKRFFFAGTDGLLESWEIFTIDANNGHILSHPELYTTDSHNSFFAIEYDKGLKELFTVYNNYADDATYFAEIDPATGNVYNINQIYGLNGVISKSSSYDEYHHRFIFLGDYDGIVQLIAIDAVSGNIAYTYAPPPGQEIRYIEYSNIKNALYAIVSVSSAGPVFILETIPAFTGLIHIIGEFPAVSTSQVGANEIDEENNRFIFAGVENTTDYLYAVNIITGNLENKWPDPYLNSADPEKENVIYFSYDYISDILYALNWGPDKISPAFTGSPVCVNEKLITLSPNPGSEKTIISFGQAIADADIVIYNDIHQAVLRLHVDNTDHLDLSSAYLPSGEYFLSVTCSNGEAVKRFVIAK